MGFMDFLKGAAGFIPGVGPLISAGLNAAGGVSRGMQSGREAENAAANEAMRFALNEREGAEQALQGRGALDLRQREFAQGSQTDAFKKALSSAILKNLQDVSVNRPQGVPTIAFKGGLRPSAMGTEGREAASLMNKLAMEKLASGEKFAALPPIQRLQAPEYKKPGFWENFLGGAGAVGNAISGAQSMQDQNDFRKRIEEAIAALTNKKSAINPADLDELG